VPLRQTALAAAARVPRVSVDLSSTAAIEAAGLAHFRSAVAEARPEVVFANEAEADLVGDVEAQTMVVKRGAHGCTLRSKDGSVELAAIDAEVVDSTGAGDAFAAGFLLGGTDLALEAAARCVSHMGAMP
jgi:ribokinase